MVGRDLGAGHGQPLVGGVPPVYKSILLLHQIHPSLLLKLGDPARSGPIRFV